ncbi:hypothetical protein ACA910_022744 [Epithemia clementina (nom. ined.)]
MNSETNNRSVRVPAACLFCPEEDEDGIYDPIRDMEIVGLHLSESGRSCLIHKCCGKAVKVGDILRIKKTVVDNNDSLPEEALCCVIIRQGEEACRVGFIPRFLISAPMVNKNINKFLQVVELFAESDNIAKQQKSKQYGGVAAVVFLDEIPSME